MEVLARNIVSIPCQGCHYHSILELKISHLQGAQQVLELSSHGYRVLGEIVQFTADRLDDAISSVMSNYKYKYVGTSPALAVSFSLHKSRLNSFSNLSTVDVGGGFVSAE